MTVCLCVAPVIIGWELWRGTMGFQEFSSLGIKLLFGAAALIYALKIVEAKSRG
jgi:hypothetical protein